MGLFQKAIETYDAMQPIVGKKDVILDEVLAPVGYIITTAKIEITVDEKGNFIRARKIDEKIPIPCTEKSSGRSSGLVAHPLCDNLGYVTEEDGEKHALFLAEVKAWNSSEYSDAKLNAIYSYLNKSHVLSDCKNDGVIELDDKNNIKNNKDIVTWRVEGLGENSGAVHEDTNLMKKYAMYYKSRSRECKEELCMVTGKYQRIATQHIKGVSNFSGNAKLISSNDTLNYTYQGRFLSSDEAMTMGYEASQKAHNALKWLISNFGVSVGERRMICWNPEGKKIPKFNLPLLPTTDQHKVIPSDYKEHLRQIVNGYKRDLPDNNTVVLSAFDAATPGRLSITYYNEFRAGDFMDRLYNWDSICCWYDTRWGVQSPSLYQIVNCAFGTQRESGKVECDSKVMGQQLQRLVSCRLDGAMFPRDILKNLVAKASNLQIYTKNNADKVLFIACAVVKKTRHDYLKEEWKMALDENLSDRSYQFGRLLAVLEKIEKDTYRNGEERETNAKRETNAIRSQFFYSNRPLTAFTQIMTSLKTGYYPRLSANTKVYYEKLIGEIMEKVSLSEKEILDKPLTETYLLGYYLQKNLLYTKKGTETIEEE